MTRRRMFKPQCGLRSVVGALGAVALPTVVLSSSCSDPGNGMATGTVVASSGSGGDVSAPTGTNNAGTMAMATGAGGQGTPQGGAGGTVLPGTSGMTGTPTGGGSGPTVTGGGMGNGGGTPVAGGGGASGGQGTSMAGGSAAGSGGGGAPACGTPLGPRPAPAIGTWPPPNVTLTEVSAGTQPTAIAAPPCDDTRLFFTEKWGRIRVIKDGVLVEEPVLDMRDEVLEGGPYGTEGHGTEVVNAGKRGLVGLAFHPNYEENGRAFVMYTADQGVPGYGTNSNDGDNIWDDGDMTFAEYRRSASDPDKFDPDPVEVFLQFDKGTSVGTSGQHNGGALYVGVDGFLWASTGDPPPYDDPGSQDLNNLNGKLLRFDITASPVAAAGNYPGADPYVSSIGIRNAYKFSIDRYTGDIYVGDVGENTWEEITVERYGQVHMNHEWDMMEGLQTFNAFNGCEESNCLPPVYDYGHTGAEGVAGADNCIVGGNVYRGGAIPALQGAYIYSDYGSGKVRAIQVVDGVMTNGPMVLMQGGTWANDPVQSGSMPVFAGCFGEDAAGELYVCDYDNNRILRVDAQ